ncbi:MAG: hypothetical protein IJM30_09220 [Thermoguttaceae bacterium]|nr:hypothetical protein [Thermoguttaceae bacterium]
MTKMKTLAVVAALALECGFLPSVWAQTTSPRPRYGVVAPVSRNLEGKFARETVFVEPKTSDSSNGAPILSPKAPSTENKGRFVAPKFAEKAESARPTVSRSPVKATFPMNAKIALVQAQVPKESEEIADDALDAQFIEDAQAAAGVSPSVPSVLSVDPPSFDPDVAPLDPLPDDADPSDAESTQPLDPVPATESRAPIPKRFSPIPIPEAASEPPATTGSDSTGTYKSKPMGKRENYFKLNPPAIIPKTPKKKSDGGLIGGAPIPGARPQGAFYPAATPMFAPGASQVSYCQLQGTQGASYACAASAGSESSASVWSAAGTETVVVCEDGSCQTIATQTTQVPATQSFVSCETSDPRPRLMSGLIAEIEYLGWRTERADAPFASILAQDGSVYDAPGASPSGSGLRARLGYRAVSGWDFIWEYLRFGADKDVELASSAVPAKTTLVAPWSGQNAERIAAIYDVDLNVYRAEIGKWNWFSSSAIRPFVGFQWTDFRDSRVSVAKSAGNPSSSAAVSELSAYGLRFGAEWKRELFSGLQIYAKAAGAIAVGELESRAAVADASGTTIVRNWSQTLASPSAEAALGIGWGKGNFAAKAGYEFNDWFNASRLDDRTTDFLARGWFVSASWNR